MADVAEPSFECQRSELKRGSGCGQSRNICGHSVLSDGGVDIYTQWAHIHLEGFLRGVSEGQEARPMLKGMQRWQRKKR